MVLSIVLSYRGCLSLLRYFELAFFLLGFFLILLLFLFSPLLYLFLPLFSRFLLTLRPYLFWYVFHQYLCNSFRITLIQFEHVKTKLSIIIRCLVLSSLKELLLSLRLILRRFSNTAHICWNYSWWKKLTRPLNIRYRYSFWRRKYWGFHCHTSRS